MASAKVSSHIQSSFAKYGRVVEPSFADGLHEASTGALIEAALKPAYDAVAQLPPAARAVAKLDVDAMRLKLQTRARINAGGDAVIVVVGHTGKGKSTLINAMARAMVLHTVPQTAAESGFSISFCPIELLHTPPTQCAVDHLLVEIEWDTPARIAALHSELSQAIAQPDNDEEARTATLLLTKLEQATQTLDMLYAGLNRAQPTLLHLPLADALSILTELLVENEFGGPGVPVDLRPVVRRLRLFHPGFSPWLRLIDVPGVNDVDVRRASAADLYLTISHHIWLVLSAKDNPASNKLVTQEMEQLGAVLVRADGDPQNFRSCSVVVTHADFFKRPANISAKVASYADATAPLRLQLQENIKQKADAAFKSVLSAAAPKDLYAFNDVQELVDAMAVHVCAPSSFLQLTEVLCDDETHPKFARSEETGVDEVRAEMEAVARERSPFRAEILKAVNQLLVASAGLHPTADGSAPWTLQQGEAVRSPVSTAIADLCTATEKLLQEFMGKVDAHAAAIQWRCDAAVLSSTFAAKLLERATYPNMYCATVRNSLSDLTFMAPLVHQSVRVCLSEVLGTWFKKLDGILVTTIRDCRNQISAVASATFSTVTDAYAKIFGRAPDDAPIRAVLANATTEMHLSMKDVRSAYLKELLSSVAAMKFMVKSCEAAFEARITGRGSQKKMIKAAAEYFSRHQEAIAAELDQLVVPHLRNFLTATAKTVAARVMEAVHAGQFVLYEAYTRTALSAMDARAQALAGQAAVILSAARSELLKLAGLDELDYLRWQVKFGALDRYDAPLAAEPSSPSAIVGAGARGSPAACLLVPECASPRRGRLSLGALDVETFAVAAELSPRTAVQRGHQ